MYIYLICEFKVFHLTTFTLLSVELALTVERRTHTMQCFGRVLHTHVKRVPQQPHGTELHYLTWLTAA